MGIFDVNMSWEDALANLGFEKTVIIHHRKVYNVWNMDGRHGFFGHMQFTPQNNKLSGEVYYKMPNIYGIKAESIEYNINTTDELVSIVTALKEKGRGRF